MQVEILVYILVTRLGQEQFKAENWEFKEAEAVVAETKHGVSEHQEYLRGGVVHVQMEDIEGYTVAMAKWIPGEVREKEWVQSQKGGFETERRNFFKNLTTTLVFKR